jgi:DnaK suppressor protein
MLDFMNVDHYKTILLAKERELGGEMARRRDDALDTKTADVEDPIDAVTTAINQSEVLGEGQLAYDTLTMVRDALRRIEEGTYGICVDCGEAIETARLDAVPWTAYCLKDQEKHDKEAAANPPQKMSEIA